MSAKVEDNTTNVEVPEASPDVNESKEEVPAAPNRRMLWIGLGGLVLVALVVGITVPLINKNKNKEKDNDAGVSREASNLSASTFASIDVPQCFEPKEGDTCSTKESYEECQDLVNSGCMDIISTFSCPPQHRCAEPSAVACMLDLAACPDGETMIGRSGEDCKFNFGKDCPQDVQLPAQPEVVPCQMDVRPCPDGINSVGRSGPNCEFNFEDECPKAVQLPAQPEVVPCQMDVRPCPDGINSVGRSGPNCEFNFEDECPKAVPLPAQPEVVPCQMDVRPCPDGETMIGRSGSNCEFNFEDECPTAVQLPATTSERSQCNGDTMVCASHQVVGRVAEDNCNFAPCPETMMCTLELGICPDGSSVGRTGPNCAFGVCPDNTCTTGFHICEGTGEEVIRDPAYDCNFICKEPVAVQLPEVPDENGHPCNGFSGCEPCLNSRMECAWTGGRCEPDCVLADAACFHPRYFEGMIGPEICAIAATTEETPFDGPPPVACTMELQICPDGVTSVGRTGPNCEFEACPEAPVACTMEIMTCADGITTVGRQGPNCEFEACPGE